MDKLKQTLISNTFKNDKFSNNMFRSKSNEQLRYLCTQATSFLSDEVSDSQRAWHVFNSIYSYPLCSGGNEIYSFVSFDFGYRKTCHLPRFQCSCWDEAKKVSSITLKKSNDSGKIQNSIKAKYGVDHVSKIPEVKTKKSQFKKETAKEWLIKMQATMIERYGSTNTLQSTLLKEKVKNTNLAKFGVKNVKQRYCKSILDDINNSEIWQSFKTIQEANSKFNDFLHVDTIRRYSHRFRPDLIGTGFKIPPFHQRIIDLLNDNAVEFEVNDRKNIAPLELDIFIPKHSLAIEVNGIYWHSELNGKNKHYHLNKLKECEKKGIRLLHFWDNEIETKWSLVSSMILNRLSHLNEKVYARKCEIINVSKNDEKDFLNQNHLQGYTRSSICLGLEYDGELVSLMSFIKPRYNHNFSYELLRFCNRLNTNVVGGASKLFKHRPEGSIVSYADRRYSQGNLYHKLGFTLLNHSPSSYFYTKDYLTIYHRSNFRKKNLPTKLESFDPDLTEWENMQMNGYDRIWDCGTLVFGYN